MITINKHPGQKILELGGGESRHPSTDVNIDIRQVNGVDIVIDLSKPDWPLTPGEFDAVYASFVLEHIPFSNVTTTLKEVYKVLKSQGKALFLVPNTEAQLKWIQDHPSGWDGKDDFTSMSEVLYGSQNYSDNAHRTYLSPNIVMRLFQEAGFGNVIVQPYNDRGTDMLIEATKVAQSPINALKDILDNPPVSSFEKAAEIEANTPITAGSDFKPIVQDQPKPKREELFDSAYFNGGAKWGGYAREGYWDFPCHDITLKHILFRNPQSVLEVGCARGYILKRLQDRGIPAMGFEISKHCWMTRACNSVVLHDTCVTPWPVTLRNDLIPGVDDRYDLNFSIATLEHIPEEFLPAVIGEMARTCKRGLHGVDFGMNDDGFDKTHCSLHPKEWWQDQFNRHAPGWPVEIVDKEELEQLPGFTSERHGLDGLVKINVGSFTTMHHGWINIDIHDLGGFAGQYGYDWIRCDVRQGLPFKTGMVDLVMSNHMLEHLNYAEGAAFCKELRRIIKPTGVVRIVVPDADLLTLYYRKMSQDHTLRYFDDINENCANARSDAQRLWSLLFEWHQAAYDLESLQDQLGSAGFNVFHCGFRETRCGDMGKKILAGTVDMQPELSLYVEATPIVSG